MAADERKIAPDLADDEPVERLRTKYLQLAHKYVALVDRTEARLGHELSMRQLARWALSTAQRAVAMVRGGRIEVMNQGFLELARAGKWELSIHGLRPVRLSLRSIVLRCSADLEARVEPAAEWRASQRDRTLLLRLERSPRQRAVTVLISDVTSNLGQEAVLRHSRDRLIHQERLRMLGEAAAAVAHELSSTLRALAFRLAALETDAEVQRKHQGSLKALAEGVEHAAATVRRLHEFAQAGSLAQELVNPGVILRQAIAMFEVENPPEAEVRLKLHARDLPFVRGSAAELSHLFLNLLRNARDAMRGNGGLITVRTRTLRKQVVIEVSDEGVGVSTRNMSQLFQPFFTTKGGEGTGLGLWLAAGTMRRMGGTITARRKRRGMIFRLAIPRAEISRARARAESRRESAG